MAEPIKFNSTELVHAAKIYATLRRVASGGRDVKASSSDGTLYDLSLRGPGSDLTTAPSMTRPVNFHQTMAVLRQFYVQDSLFAYLIDRGVQFGATQMRIRALAKKDDAKDPASLTKKGLSEKTYAEQAFWDEWATTVNLDVDNVLPGLRRVKAWMLKDLFLDGMCTVVVEMGKMKVGRSNYIVPTKITTLPASMTILVREFTQQESITQERIFVNKNGQHDIWNLPITLKMLEKGDTPEIRPLREFDPETFDADAGPEKRQYGFVVKYNHSPSDPSLLGSSLTARTGQGKVLQTYGLYPTPPFKSLQGPLTVRQQGESSDLAVLDALISQILLVKVGDERHDIRPDVLGPNGELAETGTLRQIADMLAPEGSERIMQLILPYYVELEKLETNTDTLVKAEKYVQATMTLLSAFGVLMAPLGLREDFSEINRANFEETLDYSVGHVLDFFGMLTMRMVKWNGHLSSAPTIYSLPVNTKTEAFMQTLDTMRTRGEVSHQTILDHVGLDAAYERQILAEELATGTKQMLDDSVPIQFVQTTGLGGAEGGDSEKTESSGGNKPGSQGTSKQSKPSGTRKSGSTVQKRPRK